MSKIAILTVVMCLIVFGGCVAEAAPTATPPPEVQAQQLWYEYDANRSRFDQLKGSWIRVSGNVREVKGGEVRLYGENRAYLEIFPRFISLHDLPQEFQASAVKDQPFTAICQIDNQRWNSINLRKCRQ